MYARPISLVMMILMVFVARPTYSQCSETSLQEKYERYSTRLHRHFIVQDRNEDGTINDGIGTLDFSNNRIEKQGFGLPASVLFISPTGAGMPYFESSQARDFEPLNIDCWANQFSWSYQNDNHQFNWLNYGSETLTQLAWYLIVMATDYEINRLAANPFQMQYALEEIFLGLQAIRRLDMRTQMMLNNMYASHLPGDIICDEAWKNHCKRQWNYDQTRAAGTFQPDYSGYNGFFIRSDAGQQLIPKLQDTTDESWNIAFIGGDYAYLDLVNTHANPACTPVDEFCTMAHGQWFISHDQVMNLLYAFKFIATYIPENAIITTADGVTYSLLPILHNITKALLDPIANQSGKRIVVPGSDQLTKRPIKLSQCAGGDTKTTIYAMKTAGNDILGKKRYPSSIWERWSFSGTAGIGTQKWFYTRMITLIKPLNASKDKAVIKRFQKQQLDIYPLANMVLYGDDPAVLDAMGGEQYYENLLCMAPDNGTCQGSTSADQFKGEYSSTLRWPKGFTCDNVAGWMSTNRWGNSSSSTTSVPSRSNGLDFMALYNLYKLYQLQQQN